VCSKLYSFFCSALIERGEKIDSVIKPKTEASKKAEKMRRSQVKSFSSLINSFQPRMAKAPQTSRSAIMNERGSLNDFKTEHYSSMGCGALEPESRLEPISKANKRKTDSRSERERAKRLYH
jgi:hypothetical protein